MKIITSIVFSIGAFMLVLHLINELSRPGLFNDAALPAIGIMVMAGVAHMIWGKD